MAWHALLSIRIAKKANHGISHCRQSVLYIYLESFITFASHYLHVCFVIETQTLAACICGCGWPVPLASERPDSAPSRLKSQGTITRSFTRPSTHAAFQCTRWRIAPFTRFNDALQRQN